MIEQVKQFCYQYGEPRDTFAEAFSETPVDFGIKRQKQRIYSICDYSVGKNSGDILQVGCGDGRVSKILCEVAKKHDRTVTCIDPFTKRKDNSNRSEKISDDYYKFLISTSEFGDRVHHHMEETSTEMSDALMQLVEYAFVYIAGDRDYDTHANEIDLASMKNKKTGIICLDNLRKNGKRKSKSMLDLYQDKINQYGFGFCWNQGNREGYMLP